MFSIKAGTCMNNKSLLFNSMCDRFSLDVTSLFKFRKPAWSFASSSRFYRSSSSSLERMVFFLSSQGLFVVVVVVVVFF